MVSLAATAIYLITLHLPGGGRIDVNPAEIITLREPTKSLLENSVRCIVNMADGKFVSVIETCETVRQEAGRH